MISEFVRVHRCGAACVDPREGIVSEPVELTRVLGEGSIPFGVVVGVEQLEDEVGELVLLLGQERGGGLLECLFEAFCHAQQLITPESVRIKGKPGKCHESQVVGERWRGHGGRGFPSRVSTETPTIFEP